MLREMPHKRRADKVLDFGAVSLSPLNEEQLAALRRATFDWKAHTGLLSIAATTLSPGAYRRKRLRLAALTGAVSLLLMGAVAVTVASVVWIRDGAGALLPLAPNMPYWIGSAGLLCGYAGFANWALLGGRARTQAGGTELTTLTFRADMLGLVVRDGRGSCMSGGWSHWWLARVRTRFVVRGRYGSGQYAVEALELALVDSDGRQRGRVCLDPETLDRGDELLSYVLTKMATIVHIRI